MELKSHQKLKLMSIYLLPRFIQGLVAVPSSMGALANIDVEVRRMVRDIYKLHLSTTDGILYRKELRRPRVATNRDHSEARGASQRH